MANFQEKLDVLEQAARRDEAEEKGRRALHKARARMLCEPRQRGSQEPSREDYGRCAFFAHIALQLQPEIDWDCPTLCTDGKKVYYNPEFVAKLADDEVYAVNAHECGHVIFGHHLPSRVGNRNLELWNVAADLALNDMLKNYGFKLPSGAVFPGEKMFSRYKKGLSVEEYYRLLEDDAKKTPPSPEPQPSPQSSAGQGQGQDDDQQTDQGQGEGQGEGDGEGEGQADNQPGGGQGQPDLPPDPGGCGGVAPQPCANPAEEAQAEGDHKMMIASAAHMAKQRGTLPGDLAGLVDDELEPRIDPWEVLREFISASSINDFKMPPCDRRLIQQNVYVPTLESDELGDLYLAWDCSGSLFSKDDIQFVAENVAGILSIYDELTLTIIYHDAAVQHVQTWKRTDGALTFEPKGGGGTSHVPVFDWMDENAPDANCLVCITDMYTEFPPNYGSAGPSFPVLWCSTSDILTSPFGQVVDIKSAIEANRR